MKKIKNIKLLILLFLLFTNKNIFSKINLDNPIKVYINDNFDKTNRTYNKIQTYYYPNGNIKSKLLSIKDFKIVFQESYYETGTLKKTISSNIFPEYEYDYIRNYDENGMTLSEGRILNDEKVGVWNYYDQNGKINHSYNNTSDEITVFNSDGETVFVIQAASLVKGVERVKEEIENDRASSLKERN